MMALDPKGPSLAPPQEIIQVTMIPMRTVMKLTGHDGEDPIAPHLRYAVDTERIVIVKKMGRPRVGVCPVYFWPILPTRSMW